METLIHHYQSTPACHLLVNSGLFLAAQATGLNSRFNYSNFVNDRFRRNAIIFLAGVTPTENVR
jgi:hypothetical protein